MKRDDLLDLNDVLQHPGRKLAVDISTELPEETEVDLLAPLEGYLEAVSTGNLLLITGKFTTKANVECARCGAPLEKDVEFEVEEQFTVEGVPSSFNAQDYARVVTDEPFPLFEGNNLIVEALLRQDLLIAMPVQPLCKHGWEDPCPVAEARGETKQSDPGGHPEFNKLRNLLKREEDGS
jgi:uncharacterized protein